MSIVLVTGAAGRIGSTVCAGLRRGGWTVRGTDLTALPDEVQGASADLTDPMSEAVLAELLDGADAILHLPGSPVRTPGRPRIFRTAVNCLITLADEGLASGRRGGTCHRSAWRRCTTCCRSAAAAVAGRPPPRCRRSDGPAHHARRLCPCCCAGSLP